jgi:hypothetical protein
MTQLVGLLIVPVAFAVVLWVIMHQSRTEQKAIESAQRLIKIPAHDNGAEIVFRKPRALGYMLILSFVAMCCLAAYSLIHYWGHLTPQQIA